MERRQRRDLKREKVAEAKRLFRMAYALQLEGDLDRAILLYEKSIRFHSTAEALTHLGWAKSTKGQLDEAVAHCLEAIPLDPEFPNPWNDIGAYMIEQGQAADALFFLKRAIRLQRQPSRCFPHYNLHRAYLDLGDRHRAVQHLQAALEVDPDFTPAIDALSELLYPRSTTSSTTGSTMSSSMDQREEGPLGAALTGTPVLAFPRPSN